MLNKMSARRPFHPPHKQCSRKKQRNAERRRTASNGRKLGKARSDLNHQTSFLHISAMGRINSSKASGDDDEEVGSLRRQPSSATAGSIPAQPGAYRVESRAPNRQRRTRGRSGEGGAQGGIQSNEIGRRESSPEDVHAVEADCTDAVQAVALAQSQSARTTTSAQLSLAATRVEEGQTQVVEALDAAVIDDGLSGSNPSSSHKSADRIRKKDWIIVGLVIGVAVIVVAVVLGIRLS